MEEKVVTFEAKLKELAAIAKKKKIFWSSRKS